MRAFQPLPMPDETASPSTRIGDLHMPLPLAGDVAYDDDGGDPHRPRSWRERFRAWRPLLLFVLLPTLLVAAFEYLVAADQYESEALFSVRSAQSAAGSPSALAQMMGLGAPGAATDETRGLKDYLTSHDAVAAIGRSIDLREIFRRPEADPVTRLWSADAPPETLLEYFRDQVSVGTGSDAGYLKLTVRAFRPEDARRVTELLLRLGEQRVNSLNQRAMEDAIRVSRRQLTEAEAGVADAQSALTIFRQRNRNIDPERTSAAQISLGAEIEGRLATARAQLSSMEGVISPNSPQLKALRRQVGSMQAEVGRAQGRLAGPPGAMANALGSYERLRLQQEFAAKRYEAAATAVEGARKQALAQQLFIVRVVEPNLPVKSLHPKRLKIVAIVFFGLLLAYFIGWLLLAGVREHAA